MERDKLEPWLRPIVGGLVVLVTLLVVVGLAIREPRPHDIPVGLSGPPAAVDPLVAGFGQNAPGAFAFSTYASEAEARAAIESRDVVGALVVGQAGPRLVIAAGAGEAITGAVSGAFSAAFDAQGTELAVEVVNPLPAGDAHGIVLFFLVLATAIASVVAGAAATLGRPGRGWGSDTLLLATFAVSAGVAGVATAAWLADGYGDGVWAAMAVAALLALAVSLVAGAAARWLGAGGVALAAAVVVLLGLVSSGGPLGSAFLPDAYRAIAPWLPVGPAVDAMRGALAFGNAGLIAPVAVLVGWAAIGIIGLVAAEAARRPVAERPGVVAVA
ncbi:MAG: hypothetical protein EPO36_12325 [Chloroflexota bacterium]|nr:MAG: hypothetical protein EPO36_12325 [Chloroflexota bacterium]